MHEPRKSCNSPRTLFYRCEPFALLCKGERVYVCVQKLQLAQLSFSGSFSWLMQRRSATNKMATGSRTLKLWHFYPPAFVCSSSPPLETPKRALHADIPAIQKTVLCLYRTLSVPGRRGLKRSLVMGKKSKRFIVCKYAARFKKGSRKVHDAWRTSEATLTSCFSGFQ